ncbi:MAG: AAA family ATPase [Saprospiraceae bacterium]|nr:AAA family ATPase [Saprospiraceae bacterium]
MYNPDLASILYHELLKIHHNQELSLSGKIDQLNDLLILVFNEATKDEKIQFNTLFAKIAYACHRYKISGKAQFFIHTFRKVARSENKKTDSALLLDCLLGIKVLAETILTIFESGMPADLIKILPPDNFYNTNPIPIAAFKPKVRVLALDIDEKHHQLKVVPEDEPEKTILLQYNISERNENFNPTIQTIVQIGFPITLQLLDVAIDHDEIYRPSAIVIEPDYLVDVTSVAESFKDYGADPIAHILKKFLPYETTKAITVGNIANMFLDELMANPKLEYKELFIKAFKQNPFAFVFWEDADVKEVNESAKMHFQTLQKMVLQDFENQNIEIKDCFLEPTFYSENYGLQGRLDVFYQNKKNDRKGAIIELKSSKLFKPNSYGLNHSHYYQTLLYDLLLKSAFGSKMDATNYILYSRYYDNPLRYAPTSKTQQYEALQIRNQIVGLEKMMALQKEDFNVQTIIEKILQHPLIRGGGGFSSRDLQLFSTVYSQLTALEKLYFNSFVGFIAREQHLAKIGIQDLEDSNGTASLWLNTIKEKEDRFSIINNLKIKTNLSAEEDPLIIFEKTENTHVLSNFRDGDIGVLYPFSNPEKNVLGNQVFKCNIIKVDENSVVIRLRCRQFNYNIFQKNEFWNIEHDLLDTSFNNMYRQIFEWAASEKVVRSIWLGTAPPNKPDKLTIPKYEELLPNQQDILQKMLASNDYFLLWGPPGTGKTSIMVKYFVQYILEHTEEKIMLLAYTNRAVDEICDSIEKISSDIKNTYFRIGSRFSTGKAFQGQLLDDKIKDVGNRKALKDMILGHRIVVATVSSIVSKPEILELMDCTRIVIDEASQILEPMLVGLLTRFAKVILIGDHLQLPAVVTQDPKHSIIIDENLNELCLTNLRDSLFERLFLLCKKNNWNWAYSQLEVQGRMHEDLMYFPSKFFYQNTLKTLPQNISSRQYAPLPYSVTEKDQELLKCLATKRCIFIDTPIDISSIRKKTNQYEADTISLVVKAINSLYENHQKEISHRSIGIITPYRAQIAKIKDKLLTENINIENLSIDTVERYQGGARDIIILSLCTNNESQLSAMASLSKEGVDRKLNVALTRAKEQIILIGNKEILQKNTLYRSLLQTYHPIDAICLLK